MIPTAVCRLSRLLIFKHFQLQELLTICCSAGGSAEGIRGRRGCLRDPAAASAGE